MTAAVDSRLGLGTLTLGSSEFGPQISNVRLVPDHATEDGTPTLGDPTPAPDVTTTWTLSGSAVQDWESATGFVEYCRDNNNVTVTFSWEPNTTHGTVFSGSCKVTAIEFGGDVSVQNSSDFAFVVVGALTRAEA
jgi:hypothetical protein